ncbi:hypothetical protein CSUB01_11907 [Colletotrichum sublineola]|uniref:Uncharacterized protein n=1 Tax=Colletotrichum sublineola TaxID=1173701 RepID=A0A066XWR2_COLSU|nr:hypothetical protein CSUB01_11907 [Colletotrichum sublineola]
MYQPRTERPQPRLPPQMQPQRHPPYLRAVRVPRRSGYQQAVGGSVRAQRQGLIASAAQGKNSPNSASNNPQSLPASSTSGKPTSPTALRLPSISRTSSRKVSETQEDDPELRTYLSEELNSINQGLCNLTEEVRRVSERMEQFHRIFETAGALEEPEDLETDDLGLGDMTDFVNY